MSLNSDIFIESILLLPLFYAYHDSTLESNVASNISFGAMFFFTFLCFVQFAVSIAIIFMDEESLKGENF